MMRRRGFTLIEMLVVIAIVSVVGAAITSLIVYFYRSNAYLLEQTNAVDSASRGLSHAFQALRESSYGEDGSYPIANAATSTVTFFSDIDTDASIEKVRLYLSGTTFYEGVTEATGTPPTYAGQTEKTFIISQWVKNATTTPIFRYFDADGNELTGTIALASIARVRTHLDVDLNPLRLPNIFSMEETATLRNLR